jgi:hypothetical protein
MTNIRTADAERVFECHASVVAYANRQLGIVDGVEDRRDVRGSSPREVQQMREALYENPGLLHGFVWENPAELDAEDLALVASWRAFEQGRFLVRRFTSEYAEFLDLASPHRLFAVNALHDSFKRMGVDPPQVVSAVLLPFGGRIVSDGHLHADAFVTDAITEDSDEEVAQARARYGLIDRLPAPREPTKQDFQSDTGNPPVKARQRLDQFYREAVHGDSGAAYQLIAQYEQALRTGDVDPETDEYEKYYYDRVTSGLDTIALLEGWSFLSELMNAYEPEIEAVAVPVVGAVGNAIARYVLRTRQTGSVDDIPAEALEYLLACSTAPMQTRPWRESTAVGWGLGHDDIQVTEAVRQALSEGRRDEWATEVLQHAFYADQHDAVDCLETLDVSVLSELSENLLKTLPKPNAWPPGPSGAWWEEFGYQFELDEDVREQVTSLIGT